MTMCYSVTKASAFNYFIEDINDIGVDISKSTLKTLKNDFNVFFNFLKNSYELLFYKENSKSLLKMSRVLLIDCEVIYLTYFKNNKIVKDVKNINHRDTIQLQQVSNEIDLYKSNIAFRANLIHYSDGKFAKKINENYEIYFIHDEFIIPVFKYPIILDHANFILKSFIKNN